MSNMHVNEPLLKEIMRIQGSQAMKISDFDNKISGVEKGVDRILYYLENDEATGTKGIVAKQKDMSKRISLIENDRARERVKTKTTIAVASSISGVVATIFTFLAKYVFFKS